MARHARNPPAIWGVAAMGHPWPSAAKPASCRFTPQITVRFRPSCLTGRFQIKIKSADQKTADFVIEKDVRARARATATATATATAEPYSVKGGSWLACDSINSVCLIHRGACIAGKPAPTEKQLFSASKSAADLIFKTSCGQLWERASPLPHLDRVASCR